MRSAFLDFATGKAKLSSNLSDVMISTSISKLFLTVDACIYTMCMYGFVDMSVCMFEKCEWLQMMLESQQRV